MKETSIIIKTGKAKTRIASSLLKSIVELLEDSKENTKTFQELANFNHHLVKKCIANKKHINKKTIKILLKSKYHEAINVLLSNESAAKKISHKQIEKIIKIGDPAHCENIMLHLNNFTKCDTAKIAKTLSKHKDIRVRLFVVKNYKNNIPKNIIKKLTKDKEPLIANAAKISLKEAE